MKTQEAFLDYIPMYFCTTYKECDCTAVDASHYCTAVPRPSLGCPREAMNLEYYLMSGKKAGKPGILEGVHPVVAEGRLWRLVSSRERKENGLNYCELVHQLK